MSDNHETQASAARAVVSQRSVGDLTGLILGNSLEIMDRIGRGGMGSVYLARHRDWNLSLAVKSPRPDLLSSDTDKERWLLEAQTWIDLGVHPNIVRCWFIREHRGTPLLFLDYIGGGSLKEALEQRRFGVANWPRILDLAIQACDGLEHAHQSGIVHRDVKPANFLLDDEGRLFVTDFGLVKLQGSAEPSPNHRGSVKVAELEQGLTSTGTVLGTPNYCAPEQWLQQDVGAPADLYAMGVVLYEMTTGQLPFEASPGPLGLGHLLSQVLTEEPTPPRRLQPSCPESLEALILQLLAKDPQDRPPSAAALRQELVNLYAELTGTPYPRPAPKPVEAVVDVLNNKAVSLYSLGRKKTADETWQQALRLDSLHPDVVYNRSWLLWRQGRLTPGEATQSLRQVTSTYPRGALHCGLAYLWAGDMEAAVAHLGEAVHQAEAQTDSSAWRHYGDALLGAERYLEAEQAYQQALQLNPNDQTARTHCEMAQAKSRRRQGRCYFPRLQPLLHMKRPHRLTQVTPAGSGWLWLGPEHMELLPADSRSRSWSLFHDVGLRKVAVSASAGRIVALESLPAGTWDLANGNALTTLENGERFYCLTPDGRHSLAGLVELHLVDLETGQPTTGRTLRGHEKQVLCALFCGDKDHVLTGSCDRTARYWSLERGQCLQTLAGHRDFVTCVAFSQETGLALTGSKDGTARSWRLDTGECFRILEEGGAPVSAVSFARQGQFAVVQTHVNEAEPWTSIWDLRSGESSRRFPGLSRVSPDGAFVLTARRQDDCNLLEVREVASGCLRRSTVLDDGNVSDLCFSGDGRFFACVTHTGSFYLFEFDESFRVFPQELLLTYTRGGADLEQSRERFSQLMTEAEALYSAARYAESLQLLQRARQVPGYRRDPLARALTRKLAQHLSRGGLQSCWEVRLLSAAGGAAESPIVLLPQDRLLTANDKILRLWDAQRGNCIRGFPGHTETIRAIALSEDLSRAVSGSLDRGVRCWNLDTGECLRRVAASRGGVTALYWVPDTAQVVALTNQYVICGLDFAGLQETFQNPATGCSWMLGFKEQVWTGGPVNPGRLQIFHALTGKLLRSGNQWRLSPEAGEQALLASAAVLHQPDGNTLQGITASPDGRIHLWDLSEGRHLAVLLNAGGRVTHLAVSADGLCLAAGLESGWVQIWDLEHRALCQVLEGPWGRLSGLALAADGCELFILGSDRVLRVWEMEWELTEEGARRQLLHTPPKEGLFMRLLRSFRR